MNSLFKNEKPKTRLKVRLTTERFFSKGNYKVSRNLYFYKKPNPEHLIDCFVHDFSCIDNEAIINLDRCEDGVYELILTNVSIDYETGYADDWDWKLIPWKEEINK